MAVIPKEISDAAYPIAWQKLDERYDNERVVIEKSLKSLKNGKMTSPNNAKSITDVLQYLEDVWFIFDSMIIPSEWILVFLALRNLDNVTLRRF